jgi:HSP20 family protein
MADRQTEMIRPVRQERDLVRGGQVRWDPFPFRALRRFADEFDRMFEDFGFGTQSGMTTFSKGSGSGNEMWAPDVEAFQKGDQLVIKADLPGLSKDDVTIDVTDDAVTIQGERKAEQKEEREGYYRRERSYGSFYRVIPLPQGAITEQAKAEFRDGVLEITMPAPPASKGRRLEIRDSGKK